MDLRSFYENNGMNYDTLLQRLMGKEELAHKYIQIFLADPTYLELSDAVAAKDYNRVGKKAHTLKGIALNLNLESLSLLCMDIMDSVRSDSTADIHIQFQCLTKEYEHIVSELQN